MITFDQYFSNGLVQPPTRYSWIFYLLHVVKQNYMHRSMKVSVKFNRRADSTWTTPALHVPMSRSHELRFRYVYLYNVYYRCDVYTEIYIIIFTYAEICIYIYICIQIYLHTYSYIYIQTCIYINIYISTYTNTHTEIYIYIFTYRNI